MPYVRRRLPLILASGLLIAAGAFATAPAVAAKDGDVIATGNCSGAADWKLKLSKEDGRIEVEFEVDSNRNGQVWSAKVKRDGAVLKQGQKTTKAPSGSFEFRALISNRAGKDTVIGRARNVSTGQVCRGAATI